MMTQRVLLGLFFSCCPAMSLFGCAAAAHKVEVAELRAAYAIHQPSLTCEQANQFSYQAVERLGYTIRSFTPAAPDETGILNGVRVNELGDEPVSVQITCTRDGVHVGANAESPLDVASETALPSSSLYTVSQSGISGTAPARVYFRRAFYAHFMGLTETASRGEPAPPSGQMQVIVKPLVGLETTVAFGKAVTDVLAVRVEISNTTPHSYEFDTDKVILRTPEGKRVKPLPTDHTGYPVPPLSRQRLASGVSLKGYLYYPPGSYTGARGSRVDKENQDQEGFDVQF